MTFTLVVRCASTGRLGIGTASASLAVGARCPFISAGAGAVSTQNRTDPTIGPLVLNRLRQGLSAPEALASVTAEVAFPEWRQVAVVDAQGRVATHHGERCSGIHAEAREDGAVALGNLLASPDVPSAMIAAFTRESGVLEDRITSALAAGLAAGGEINPLRSAALLVVAEDPFPYTNLRIDFAARPLDEMRALLQMWRPEADRYRNWAVDPYAE